MQGIKNIIIDLGGVLLELDINRTNQAYREMGINNIDDLFKNGFSESFFKDYEKGTISSDQFIDSIQNLAKPRITKEEILFAWNALLIRFPPERIEWLKKLKDKYRLFLFSNTNDIHHEHFHAMYKKSFSNGNFDDLFEKVYYSHLAGVRKPDAASYDLVVNENKLDRSETVFIDDALINIEGAQKTGLHVIHLHPEITVLDLKFDD